ncbi:hypothetical protein [Streptomyces aurantiogriseus]|uniref:Uncharacterized protein n=1 Tax=Streptomyces aurantiogriseus TaxID=66870 RepID=A0A918FJA7_9ACTN|nr:hypothetical protein [Streptomyces aurantiogriseus]GGR42407.1 hypothetical protein GCM10010251_69300 [Streptomyces aurantiogriseus]
MFALLGFALIFAVPVWCIAVVVKLISVALPGRRPDWGVHLLRWSAGMAAAAAIGVYLMAAGAVEFSDHESRSGTNSSPAPACRDGVARETVRHLVGHRASYLPPRFDCVLDDGTTYASSGGYAWMNTLVVVFAVTAAALAVAGRYAAERRARSRTAVEPPPSDDVRVRADGVPGA